MGFRTSVLGRLGQTLNYDTECISAYHQGNRWFVGQVSMERWKVDVPAMRVIADHIRTIAFSITDGQLPSNAKTGYVIPPNPAPCRSLRLHFPPDGNRHSCSNKLVAGTDWKHGCLSELKAQQSGIEGEKLIRKESFLHCTGAGIRLLDKTMAETKAAGKTEINGVDILHCMIHFSSHSTLTELILRENGLTAGSRKASGAEAQKKQKTRPATPLPWSNRRLGYPEEGETTFVGYDYTDWRDKHPALPSD